MARNEFAGRIAPFGDVLPSWNLPIRRERLGARWPTPKTPLPLLPRFATLFALEGWHYFGLLARGNHEIGASGPDGIVQ